MPELVRRHQLVYPDIGALEGEGLKKEIFEWFQKGFPGIVRRPCFAENNKICLGFPFPPSLGKLRLSCELSMEKIGTIKKLPNLMESRKAFPEDSSEALDKLQIALNGKKLSAYTVGSIAWETLTGVSYVTGNSDIDLLFIIDNKEEFEELDAILEKWHSEMKRKCDIEIMFPNGNGFLWKEYRQSNSEVLVKGNSKVYRASLEQLFA
jgi:phosphoribosyl-dephospho-CoA transferase